MRLALDMLEPSPEVEELVADVGEMEVMIEAYLAFARGEGEEAVTPVDLDRLLREAAAAVRRQGAQVEYAEQPGLVLPLRPNAMRRCFINLLVNAHRHADAAWISVAVFPRYVDVLIDDDGPGVPARFRDDVFRPFLRLDPSRGSENGGGSGLGLTIARDAARSHGGDILLEDSPRGGLRALVRLPR